MGRKEGRKADTNGESWTAIASYIINVDPRCTENGLTSLASDATGLLARGDFEPQ